MSGSTTGTATVANPNIYQQSAGAYTDAIGAANMAALTGASYQPVSVSAPSVSAPTISAPGPVNATTIGATNVSAPSAYTPMQIGNLGQIEAPMIQPTYNSFDGMAIDPVLADQVSQMYAGQLSETDLTPYLNPFTQNVIDTTQAQMDKALQTAINETGDRATAASAYGGTRHGVAEGVTNAEYVDQAAEMAAQLYYQNHMQALQSAGVDIGNEMAAQQFNIGNEMQLSLANQQAAMQAAMANQALQGQFSLADQNAALQAAISNQRAALESDISSMQFNLQAMQADQQAALSAGLADRAAQLQASISNQQADLAAAQSNQQALLQAEIATAQNTLSTNLANQSTGLQAALANAQNSLSADLANQQAAYNAAALGANTFLGASSNLGNLSALGYNIGTGVQTDIAQVGAQQQALQQMLIDAANSQFSTYTAYPYNSLSLPLAAVGAADMGQSTTTSESSYSPGLFDFLPILFMGGG